MQPKVFDCWKPSPFFQVIWQQHIPWRYSKQPVQRYNTGDWVKSIADGIQLFGRVDRQVKNIR